MRAWLVLVILTSLFSGCFGSEPRTEWAYEVTQLDDLAGQGLTGRGVRIAILDTGVDAGHPALRHLVDGDTSNGELVAFRDFLEPAQGAGAAHDPDGHGTHVTGIVAARPTDVGDRLLAGGVRLMGGAPDAQFIVARVCTSSSCDANAIIDAIGWAAQQGADVLSLSLGGNPNVPGLVSDALQDDLEGAVRNAIDRGVVVVAAAGNDATSARDVAAPGNIPQVIAVGALGEDLRIWHSGPSTGSQQGDVAANECRSSLLRPIGRCPPDQKPELVAPGVEILSAYADGTYASATGTSQATPFVTSAVALMLEGRPDVTDAQGVRAIKVALVESAQKLTVQERPHDDRYGYGLVQAASARARL